MPPPPVVTAKWRYQPNTNFGALLLEAMAPWVQAAPTAALAWYLDAMGAMFDETYNLSADQGMDGTPGYVPGYGALFDPRTCPPTQLPYLGQFVGVPIPVGTDPATARSLVMMEQGSKRGTPAAIVAAAKRNLVGTKSVILAERTYADGATATAGWFVLIVHPEELSSPAALIAAVNAVKPAGMFFTVVQTDGFAWLTAIHTWTQDGLPWNSYSTTQP